MKSDRRNTMRRAREAAYRHRHLLGRFRRAEGDYWSECRFCGKAVQVLFADMPEDDWDRWRATGEPLKATCPKTL